MSEFDREVLEGADVSQKEAAQALEITPQRVSQLIAARKIFLTPVKVEKLYTHLKAKTHPGAETFKHLAEQKLPGAIDQLRPAYIRGYHDSIIHKGAPRPWEDASEMWVFSCKPKEVYDPEYLKSIKDRFFTISPDTKLQTIVYFVPGDIALQLCRYFTHYFQQLASEQRASVTVVETSATLISPRFVIFDPRSTMPIGVVVIDGDDTYARLPHGQVSEILEGLARSGIGGDVDEIYVPPPFDAPNRAELPNFIIRFDSHRDAMPSWS